MANTIQIKRSSTAQDMTGETLARGELAWVDDSGAGTIYIGDAATGAIKAIGGDKGGNWGEDFRTDTALLGTTTMAAMTAGAGAFDMSGATSVTAPTVASPTENSTKVATTAWVNTRIATSGGAFSTLTDVDFNSLDNHHMAFYDADADNGNGKWINNIISGDVGITKGGVATVSGVQANAINLLTDTASNYVATIANSDSNLAITGSGATDAAVQIDLATNVSIAGNLTVGGTTTQVDSTTVTVSDPVLVLGESTQGSLKDSGVEYNWHDGTENQGGFFGWDRSADEFTFIPDATNILDNNGDTTEVFSGNAGNARFANIAGTLTTAAQPNVTDMVALQVVGTISTGVWNGNTVAEGYGGTGQNTYAAGDILYADGADSLARLTKGSDDMFLQMNGNAPAWSSTLDGGTF